MKLKIRIITSAAAAASILTLSAFGAESIVDRDVNRPALRTGDPADSSRLDHGANVAKASDVIGMEVKNLQGEKLGKVENILIDLPSSRIVQVVISSGGFLGLGDELSAVPPKALRYDPSQKVLALDMTKEALAQAPHFNRRDWANFSDSGSIGNVDRGSGSDRSVPGTASEPDNSGRNVRDRSGTLTPSDQASNKSDVEVTREIRKEIVSQKDLSVNAQNAKIITAGGHVTLRGPVNSEDEKRRL